MSDDWDRRHPDREGHEEREVEVREGWGVPGKAAERSYEQDRDIPRQLGGNRDDEPSGPPPSDGE